MKGKGLITKNVNPGFEMIRTGSSYNPLQSTANMLGGLGFPVGLGGYNPMSHIPQQFLQQSKRQMYI